MYHNWQTGIYSVSDGIYKNYAHEDEINFLRTIIVDKLGKEHLWDENGEYKFREQYEYSGFAKGEGEQRSPSIALKIALGRHMMMNTHMLNNEILFQQYLDEVMLIIQEHTGMVSVMLDELPPLMKKLGGYDDVLKKIHLLKKLIETFESLV